MDASIDDDCVFSHVFFGPLFVAILVIISLIILLTCVPSFGRY